MHDKILSNHHSCDGPELLEVIDLKKHYSLRKGIILPRKKKVFAVNGVTFTIRAGETLGLVGESGCGKSTVGMSLLRLIEPTSGMVKYKSVDIVQVATSEMRQYRRQMQMIFQDPYRSVNPRMTIGDIVGEPLENFKLVKRKKKNEIVKDILQRVGLRNEQLTKYPHQLSGGQLQRVGIARALILNPDLIVCDEVVSALDVSVQAQVLNLLMDLQEEFHFSYLFITHDLAVVEYISHRIAVMYMGKIVELTKQRRLFTSPLHPYTQALLEAAPLSHPKDKKERMLLTGEVPSPVNPPTGCCFHTRCPFAMDVCKNVIPVLSEVSHEHLVACHLRK